MKWLAFAPIALAALVSGCGNSAPPAPPPPAAAASAPKFYVPTQAQPKLPTMKLWLGPEELSVEVALTPIQQETGMMFRTNLEENAGMIFVSRVPTRVSYWMTNCPLPLSAAYIDSEGVILEIHELKANDATPVPANSDQIQYVLEVNDGWFDRHHIAVGTALSTEMGSLPDTFFRRR